MAMQRVATLPLIYIPEDQNLTHKWYADENSVAGSPESLRILLGKLYEHCGTSGKNVIKCHLITKFEFVSNNVFGNRCCCFLSSSSSGFNFWY